MTVKAKALSLSCPSAQPDMEGARIIGLVTGTLESPRIAYLEPGINLTLSAVKSLGELEPTRVFRFGAHCEQARCKHFDGAQCALGRRVASQLERVVEQLPACQIRKSCRWYAEQGRDVCLRCPQIITMVDSADALSRIATTE